MRRIMDSSLDPSIPPWERDKKERPNPESNPQGVPAALLVHDGELADVGHLLGELGIPFGERRGTPTAGDGGGRWDLVIATPKRMLEFPCGVRGARIAILEADSKTLRSMLQREGIDLFVRRPVHPAALRLLVIYTLYHGPEKRRAERVAVGHEVRYRTGRLRRLPAALIDLSMSGCLLMPKRHVDVGSQITLHLPRELTGRKSFAIGGTVIRASSTSVNGEKRGTLAIAFVPPDPTTEALLHQAVRAHVSGPALSQEKWPDRPTPPESEADLESEPVVEPEPVVAAATTEDNDVVSEASDEGDAASDAFEDDAVDVAALETEELDAGQENPPAASPSERRRYGRRTISRPVVALGRCATRVLLGRDISEQGMRVDSHPTLCVGDEFQLAIHVRSHEAPILVNARVDRDDGERGMLLRFGDLSEKQSAGLAQLLDFLPVLLPGSSLEKDTELVVSEIVECEAEGRAASQGQAESDDQAEAS